jgi:glycosyltransferase involved in cell wall biosynthesis
MANSILYVNNTDPTDGGGGDQRILDEAKELAKRGYDVTIVAGRTDPSLPSTRTVNGIHIRTVKCLPDLLAGFDTLYFYFVRMLFPLLSVPKLIGECRIDPPDLVVDDFTPHPSLASLLSRLFSIPVIAIVHEYHNRTALEKFPFVIGVIQLGVQNILRTNLYDGVIVPRQSTKEQLREYGVSVPIYGVPNGIDVTPYEEPPDASAATGYDLLVVSRLVYRKGIDQLIDAMELVAKSQPDVRLGIAGDGPQREELQQQVASRGLEDSIEFLGYVPEEEKIALLHAADLFVLPSRQEGFGIAVLEAMATGTPVVVNDLAVLRDLVPEAGGTFVDASDQAAFADALLDALQLSETERQKCRKINQTRATEYSWTTVTDQVEEIYAGYIDRDE